MLKKAVSTIAFLSMITLVAAGCGDDGGDDGGPDAGGNQPFGECPSDSAAQEEMGAMVIADRCLICHSANLTGLARNGATPGFDFDTAADIDKHAVRIHARAVVQGSMPPASNPGVPLNDDEQEAVRVYLACDSNLDPQQ